MEKAKEYFLLVFGSASAALADIKFVLGAVLALVFIDWLTGVYKALVVKREAFTSLKWRNTVAKLVPYMLVVLTGNQVDKVAGFDADGSLYFTRAFALLLMSVETQSIGENTGFDLINIIRQKLTPPPKE